MTDLILDDGTDRHAHPTTGPFAGKWATPTLSSWHNARKRCYTVNHERYHRYGGAGVTMCDRWATFVNFLQDMGIRPAGTELGRINDTGNYEPGNVAWMDAEQQLAHKRNRRDAEKAS